ncbi:MAG: tRNA lysidine(34) synthetase TilS [Lachnospiraceae bacterium]|nr:tRNA lysidine(34) synthetase TilS [Lachnospiraceae bacterium]
MEKLRFGNMTQKVLDFIRKQHMIAEGDKILVGFSGGADSVALLHVLLSVREQYSLELMALHVNHGIRQEAGQDEAFCARFCQEMGVSFVCRRIEEGKLAQTPGTGLEEAARTARYELLEQCRQEYGCDKIAVAHHANDNAETMLFQLFRGSGLKGLSGIRPVRGRIIRPFLCVNRQEINQYLKKNGLEHVEDASNLDMNYTRNQLRACVIPLSEAICTGAVEHMGQCAEQLRDVWEYLNSQAAVFLEQNAEFDETGVTLPLRELKALPVALQREVLMESAVRVCGSRKDFTSLHIENMRKLLDKGGQKDCDLPHGLRARKSYLAFRIYKKESAPAEDGGLCIPLAECITALRSALDDNAGNISPEREVLLPDGGRLVLSVLHPDKMCEKINNIPQNDCTKWFDCDKINDHLLLRHRRPGDYLVVSADGSKKRLQDYLVNEKIPREERERLWLLADGSHILWVVGHRISMEYKVTAKTKNILKVHLEEKTDGGEN